MAGVRINGIVGKVVRDNVSGIVLDDDLLQGTSEPVHITSITIMPLLK